MGKGFLSKQMQLLADKDSVMRYWAVIGLRNQNVKDLNKKKLLKAYQAEKSEMVKIEMADLLVRLFGDKTQWQYLVDVVIKTPNAYAARQASMRLANYTDLPENILAQIRQARSAVTERHKAELGYSLTASLGTIIKAKVEDDGN
jgi:DNA-directed RNA polymerase subunit H (RpoH/RPB5)